MSAFTPESKEHARELKEIVAFSRNWCEGRYHRLNCMHLPQRTDKAELGAIIDLQTHQGMRNPCLLCRPPTAGRKFLYYADCWSLPIEYHTREDCAELAKQCKTVPGKPSSIAATQFIKVGLFDRFGGLCRVCEKPKPASQSEVKIEFKSGDRIRRSAKGRETIIPQFAGHSLDTYYDVYAFGKEFWVYRPGLAGPFYRFSPSEASLFERVPPSVPAVTESVVPLHPLFWASEVLFAKPPCKEIPEEA